MQSLNDLMTLEKNLAQAQIALGNISTPYAKHLQYQLNTHLKDVYENLEQFGPQLLSNNTSNKILHKWFNSSLPEWREQQDTLAHTVYSLVPPKPSLELQIFLNSLPLKKLTSRIQELIVRPTLQTNMPLQYEVSEPFLCVQIPVTGYAQPLHWIGIIEAFSHWFVKESESCQQLLITFSSDSPARTVLNALITLRLCGPAYYAQFVLSRMQHKNWSQLFMIEPVLFEALNHFNLNHKDFVILHQSIEHLKTTLENDVNKTGLEDVLTDTDRHQLMTIAEQTIPDRLAYTHKQLIRSQLLFERMQNNVLASAIPSPISPEEIIIALEQLGELENVYPILDLLKEQPATPLEILNAAWLYQLDNTSEWLLDCLQSSSDAIEEPSLNAWTALARRMQNRDAMVMRSIEISEVHAALTQEAHAMPYEDAAQYTTV